jgi:hypothetical protein
MSNGKQLWPGDTMRAFFRAHVLRETALDAAAAEKLSDALTKAVNRMLVWDLPADVPATAAQTKGKSKPQAVETSSPAADSAPAKAAVSPPAFDPYAFSAMVVLAKTGKDGLLKRLAEIKTAEHLKAFADAQHLAVGPHLKKPEDLRKAIVLATEQRIADRKAAAS